MLLFRACYPIGSARRCLLLLVCISVLLLPASAKSRTSSDLDPGYVSALVAADHFLQAWQAGDAENGLALLTAHAKKTLSRDDLDRFFSNPEPSGYEVGRGKLTKGGRYEFPVVLVTGASKSPRMRRRFSTIVIVNAGNNDWAVDKLP